MRISRRISMSRPLSRRGALRRLEPVLAAEVARQPPPRRRCGPGRPGWTRHAAGALGRDHRGHPRNTLSERLTPGGSSTCPPTGLVDAIRSYLLTGPHPDTPHALLVFLNATARIYSWMAPPHGVSGIPDC